jgi:hypothetical protein
VRRAEAEQLPVRKEWCDGERNGGQQTVVSAEHDTQFILGSPRVPDGKLTAVHGQRSRADECLPDNEATRVVQLVKIGLVLCNHPRAERRDSELYEPAAIVGPMDTQPQAVNESVERLHIAPVEPGRRGCR